MMQLKPLVRVIRQNLGRNTRSLVLSAFGIAVGIAAFVFFWGLSGGVSRVVLHDIFPIDRVEVITPKTSLTGSTVALDDGVVAALSASDEVSRMTRERRMELCVALRKCAEKIRGKMFPGA